MERQRQMEWERQRKEQLMAEKAREYEQLTALKSRSNNLKCELESLVSCFYIMLVFKSNMYLSFSSDTPFFLAFSVYIKLLLVSESQFLFDF